ncbi:MAG: hypothetical protein M1816_000279 [Peltula sp. TS41687]|nr:MAG: hypothetical protein M1816_000279 [Peltula sp. TS41687]
MSMENPLLTPIPFPARFSPPAKKILYTLLYVVPFYLSSSTRPTVNLSRDAPSVIRARIRAVTFSCLITSLSTFLLLTRRGRGGYHDLDFDYPKALHLLGYWPVSPLDVLKTLLLTAMLFTGPLFEKGLVEGQWRAWVRLQGIQQCLGGWIGWRNYIAGPTTEELVFRSCLIPLHVLSHQSPRQIVFMTPLYFGIAHVHHLYEYKLTHPHTPFLPALARSLFQFGYTSVFGFYAAFVFLRTASLPAVILAHGFCNWCGLPRFWGRVAVVVVEPGEPMGPPVGGRNGMGQDGGWVGRSGGRRDGSGVGWTVAYYFLLVLGAVGFWRSLWVLTESERRLVDF